MREPLTDRQQAALDAIVHFKDTKGYAPSLRDLGKILGIHRNAVAASLEILERKGYVASDAKVARSLRVLPDPHP